MECLKPSIKLFDNGWNFIEHIIDKLIFLILLWSSIFSSFVIRSLHSLVKHVCDAAQNLLSQWEFTPHIHRYEKRHKTSHGAGRCSQNLHASKELCYNERNCKSGRHNRQNTFMRHKPWKFCKDTNTTNLPDMVLKVKTRNKCETKSPPSRRQD